jgi:hypothetical protein
MRNIAASSLILLGLLSSCAVQPSSQADSLTNVENQIREHDYLAPILAAKVQQSLAAGASEQSINKLGINTNSRNLLIKLRDQATQRFPQLLVEPTWIAESSQLVSAEDANKVTQKMVTLYIIATKAGEDQLAWVATVTADTKTGEVLATQLADQLKPGYITAFQAAAESNGHVNLTRRILGKSLGLLDLKMSPLLSQTALEIYKTKYTPMQKSVLKPSDQFIQNIRNSSEIVTAQLLGVDGLIVSKDKTILLVKRGLLSTQSLNNLSLKASSLILSSKNDPKSILYALNADVTTQATEATLEELLNEAGKVNLLLDSLKSQFSLRVLEGRIRIGYIDDVDKDAIYSLLNSNGINLKLVDLVKVSGLVLEWGSPAPTPTPTPVQNLSTNVKPLAGGAHITSARINGTDAAGNCSIGYVGIRAGSGGFATARHCYPEITALNSSVYHPNPTGAYIGDFQANAGNMYADTIFVSVPISSNYESMTAVADIQTGNITQRLQQVYRPNEVSINSDIRLSGQTTKARRWRYISDFYNKSPQRFRFAVEGSRLVLDFYPECISFRSSNLFEGASGINGTSLGGDSGGTIFTGDTQANLIGTLTGRSRDNVSNEISECWATVQQHFDIDGTQAFAF